MFFHLHIEAETKWMPFHRQFFQMYFREWKCMNFDEKFHWSSDLQYFSTDLDNGSAPIRRQAIIKSNSG